MSNSKPLGIKAYGSIPHLPESRLGSGDHQCNPEQACIATCKTRGGLVSRRESLPSPGGRNQNIDHSLFANLPDLISSSIYSNSPPPIDLLSTSH